MVKYSALLVVTEDSKSLVFFSKLGTIKNDQGMLFSELDSLSPFPDQDYPFGGLYFDVLHL